MMNRIRRARWYLVLAAILAATAALALPLDLPLAQWAAETRLPGDLRKLVSLAEAFSHGMGVLLLLVAVLVLDRTNRHRFPRLVATSYGAGLLANATKLLVARTRPRHADLEANVLETFQGWLPVLNWTNTERPWDHVFQSFPSGHTATAVGLAIGLTWLYPHGRWLFTGLAILAGIQRIESGAHYLSDTLAAAALSCLWAGLCTDNRSALGQRFCRGEARLDAWRQKRLSRRWRSASAEADIAAGMPDDRSESSVADSERGR